MVTVGVKGLKAPQCSWNATSV